MSLVPVDEFRPDFPHQQLQLDPEAFKIIHALADAGVVTTVALVLGDDVPFPKRRLIARYFGEMSRHLQWWVGDLLNDSEARDGHEFAQLADDTGLSEGAIQARMYVCRKVAVKRRRPGLPFSAHHAVAGLPARAQDRWLKIAVDEGLTAAVLRYRIREDEREAQTALDVGDPPPPSPVVNRQVLEEAGRAILRDAKKADDGSYVVPAEDIARLRAAFDEEE